MAASLQRGSFLASTSWLLMLASISNGKSEDGSGASEPGIKHLHCCSRLSSAHRGALVL